ncbi:hypothetical protein [Paenibacillus massiliensis]|uniref:hypothetical protein n=1 Tax=Paenibacillus massiliensis TaxID=225917 RepID=UPI000472148C|nr:hypothetical protein [Paenibacillus massiliensis]
MSSSENYAVWYSTAVDYDRIVAQFVEDETGSSHFKRDFELTDEYVDLDHAVILWYGAQHGELGKVKRSANAALEEGFAFIIDPVAELLAEKGITEISYMIAIPEISYEGQVQSNDTIVFLGQVECEEENSSWLDEILNDM